MIQQIRYALRSLQNAPGFSLIAITTLALGIGVNSSLYSLLNTLIFSNAPFPERERIVSLTPQHKGSATNAAFGGFSYAEMLELQQRPDIFAQLAAYRLSRQGVALGDAPPDQIMVTALDPKMFNLLRSQPLLGRGFTEEECRTGAAPVVLLTYEFWLDRFGGEADALGKSVRISGRDATIIGVLPRSYSYRFLFFETELFTPLVFTAEQVADRDRREFPLLARLPDAQTFESADALLATVTAKWVADFPHAYENYGLHVVQVGRNLVDGSKIVFGLLSALGFAVLLISCSNLANLQLARAASRVKELAIRSALGASRTSLLRLQLTESLLLALFGGLLGLLLAAWLNEVIGSNMLIGTKTALDIELDGRVLAFTGCVSLVTAFGFGLVPAWLASRTDVNDILKSQSRGTTGGKATRWVKNFLVVAQVALALILLSTATGMVTGVSKQLNQPYSWQPEKVLFATVELREENYPTIESRRAFHEALLAQLARIPGVQNFAIANNLPNMIYGGGERQTVVHEQLDSTRNDLPQASRFMVSGNYFPTLGIPLRQGRLFDENVKATDPEQVVINETLAAQFWPNESPLGKRLGTKDKNGQVTWREVIGVVGTAEDAANLFASPVSLQYYTPFVHTPWAWFQVALRDDQPARLKNDLRLAVAELDPAVSPGMVYDLTEIRRLFLHNVYVVNGVLFGVALLGLVLASVGLYGIISNNVQHRMAEFGIRLALGAQPQNLLWMVVRQGLRLTGIGLAIGLVVTFVIGQGMNSQFPTMASDPTWNYLLTVLVVGLVSTAATWLPARQATTADPMLALRAD